MEFGAFDIFTSEKSGLIVSSHQPIIKIFAIGTYQIGMYWIFTQNLFQFGEALFLAWDTEQGWHYHL